MNPGDETSDAENARRSAQELKGFEIEIAKYSEDELHKIISLIMVYQSARERMLRGK